MSANFRAFEERNAFKNKRFSTRMLLQVGAPENAPPNCCRWPKFSLSEFVPKQGIFKGYGFVLRGVMTGISEDDFWKFRKYLRDRKERI